MRNIKHETLEKCLCVLKEMKYMADNKLKVDTKSIALKYHTSQALPSSAKRVGFFSSNGYGIWHCNKAKFDPLDARKVLENIYDGQNTIKNKINKEHTTEYECELPVELRNENKIPPKIEDVEKYCNERKNDVNPAKFMSYYEQKGWMIGKEKMKNWKMAIHTWEHKNYNNIVKKLSDYSDQELVDELKHRGYTGIMEIKNTISF
jgi:hypothetical protein